MKNKVVMLVIGLFVISVLVFSIVHKQSKYQYEVSDSEVASAFNLLNDSLVNQKNTYFDFINTVNASNGVGSYQGQLTSEDLQFDQEYNNPIARLTKESDVVYQVEVASAGLYEINLDYKLMGNALINPIISVEVNDTLQFDEANAINIPLIWKDQSKEFVPDSYGDESLPQQERVEGWQSLDLYNNTYYTADPLKFYFNEGMNIITVKHTTSGDLLLGDLRVTKPKEYLDYEQYVKAFPEVNTPTEKIFVNATDYIAKNSSYVRLNSLNQPALNPYDAVYKKLNVIDGQSWKTPGQEIFYQVEVPEDGWYEIALHYMSDKNDFNVFRTLKIDGTIPFNEMKNYEIDIKKSGTWMNEVLSDEQIDYRFYLTKGTHELSLKADYEPVSEQIRVLQLVNDHINQFALDIIKVSGKDIDSNRMWKLTKFLPQTEDYLVAYKTLIMSVIESCGEFSEKNQDSATLSFLNKAIVQLDKMMKKPDEIPLYLDSLYSGAGSVTQMIGDTITNLTEQPLYLDGFYIFNERELDKPSASIFSSIYHNTVSFVSTFVSNKYSIEKDEDALNIWVNRPITYIDTMQKLIDAQFTPSTGIKVKISAMPDANKLILSNAAKTSPDIAMGLTNYMPFDLAIRNALFDLTQFDDFWKVAQDFAPGAFIPYVLNDSIYALPETLEFQALIYRKDIVESLGLTIPNTWSDVVDILPVLQRFGMNFYHPTAGGTSLKWFYQTSPFIYQNGGTLYHEDGLSTAIDTPESVKGLLQLTQLFRANALPAQVANFYNSFRYATLPIGITQFGEYLQIKNAAPELVGKWALAPYPGTEQSDGSIDRWFISNGVGSVIFKDSTRPEESWEFLKWWMSEEVQTTYSYTLQSTFGPEYVWLSANLDAVNNAPIEENDKQVILESATWLRDVPRTPGQYMLERGLSDIWNRSVFDGNSTRVSVDKQVIGINREIRKKMIEFGFIDEEGNVLKEFIVRDIDWIIEQIKTHATKGE